MKTLGLIGSILAGAALVASPVYAQAWNQGGHDRDHGSHNDRQWRGDDKNWNPSDSYRKGNYKERRLGRNDRIYRGRDGRAYCRRSDGTTGLVVGALGGAALGNLVGGDTLGTLAGGVGGALIGRSIDRGNVKCR
ncbi:glycine zipper 2TM domain-containing protein [Novosphingobium sp. 9]|uniref:glycine zipper 2TM domain-containing protein n=1 Tax=Novosphingobium sp. 9 TaxID=2025349 RepID=UPI0021B68341|nr:glycine zipper 2TM domain-containing protein [Novosphingobium sp. 9]